MVRNDWFTSVDLKDTYFPFSIYPPHRKFLLFAFWRGLLRVQHAALQPPSESQCVRALHRGSDHPTAVPGHPFSHMPGLLAAGHAVQAGSRDSIVCSSVFLGLAVDSVSFKVCLSVGWEEL